MDKDSDLHAVALVAHTAMAVLHGLGIAFNLKRKNWIESGIHFSVLLFNLKSANSHRKELR